MSLLLLLMFTIVVVCFVFDGVICVPSPFFPLSVMGEYDLRKGEKKKKKSAVERKPLRIFFFSISLFRVHRN